MTPDKQEMLNNARTIAAEFGGRVAFLRPFGDPEDRTEIVIVTAEQNDDIVVLRAMRPGDRSDMVILFPPGDFDWVSENRLDLDDEGEVELT